MAFKMKHSSPLNRINEGSGDNTKKANSSGRMSESESASMDQSNNYTGKARKNYSLGQYEKLGFKDTGLKNNKVQINTGGKYQTAEARKLVSGKLSKLNPGMKFDVN